MAPNLEAANKTMKSLTETLKKYNLEIVANKTVWMQVGSKDGTEELIVDDKPLQKMTIKKNTLVQ